MLIDHHCQVGYLVFIHPLLSRRLPKEVDIAIVHVVSDPHACMYLGQGASSPW
jgi:hypothetical protein